MPTGGAHESASGSSTNTSGASSTGGTDPLSATTTGRPGVDEAGRAAGEVVGEVSGFGQQCGGVRVVACMWSGMPVGAVREGVNREGLALAMGVIRMAPNVSWSRVSLPIYIGVPSPCVRLTARTELSFATVCPLPSHTHTCTIAPGGGGIPLWQA